MTKMKTLVKYVHPEQSLTVRCRGFDSVSLPAKMFIAAGLGDNTVQEDGKTVWVSKDQYQRRCQSFNIVK